MKGLDLVIPSTARHVCRVRVGRGVLSRLVEDLARDPEDRQLLVISDEVVAPLHAEPLARKLEQRGLGCQTLTFPAGESHKTRAAKARLEDELLRRGAGRDTSILAVGGGVTGDLAGFVAATWHRGVPVIQVPTSLLAMVDAAIGGKTAVNLGLGKNLVGAFHQPQSVWADIDTLATLPDDEFREGIAELVKTAVVADLPLFRWLEANHRSVLERDPEALEHAIESCLRIKGRVVARDEREGGRRAVLNFGHTVAHALEQASRYELRHGSAVAIGMCVEARLAVGATGFPQRQLGRLERLLAGCRLPTSVPTGLSQDSVVEATPRDKKARAGRPRYSLPRSLGKMLPGASVTVEVAEPELRMALESGRVSN